MFNIKSNFYPTGDQPEAIEELTKSIKNNNRFQTLLGVTGSGKTFTVANIIKKVQKPTLILAHNKTLAAQLASEFKEFFPDNAVEFFVSYYDYYQPEAYIPGSDLYIEKDSSINEEIDKLRHSATAALFEREDVIIVSSVSCIYGLGDPFDYRELMLSLRVGMDKPRNSIVRKLVEIQYTRNDIDFNRGNFRVRGDVLEIFPAASTNKAIRVELFGDEIERISEIDVLTGEIVGIRDHVAIFPASHYVTQKEKLEKAVIKIEEEMNERVAYYKEKNMLVEAQRIEQRTRYDLEMLKEVGFCQGIENYSRVISGREPGSRPYTLIDHFPKDFLLVIDESHVTIPQVRGMYGGDRSRKENLIEYGFRLPSAFDNRPLNFNEFESLISNVLFVSATPGPYEKEHSKVISQQVIRPTGLIDPSIEVKPIKGQIDDLYSNIIKTIEKNERVLVVTLTKRMSEDLTTYLASLGIKVNYMHSDIDTLERMKIIRDFRLGEFDVLIGINLLREGLDLPEVSLIAILDADKEGFLRTETSLIQTIGRAARNINGRVIMYADTITGAMQRAIDETNRRRKIQDDYNKANGIEPKSVIKDIRSIIEATKTVEDMDDALSSKLSKEEANIRIAELEMRMFEASSKLEFELAIELRDAINKLKQRRR
jgi:excinuclease ABC subunit B